MVNNCKPINDLSAEYVRSLLDYDPETGVFRNKVTRSSGSLVGAVVGCAGNRGYLKVRINKRTYTLHRLAWLWMTGEWPSGDIDHINVDKLDNRWKNLRLANDSQNRANTFANRNNTSGRKGVSWDKKHKKWHARIMVNGNSIFIGAFLDLDDAGDAYKETAIMHFGEYARVA